jgi:hypothetical protein
MNPRMVLTDSGGLQEQTTAPLGVFLNSATVNRPNGAYSELVWIGGGQGRAFADVVVLTGARYHV